MVRVTKEKTSETLRYGSAVARGLIFAQIVENNPLPISLVLPDTGEFVDVNLAGCKLIGYARHELIGRKGHELGIWPDVREWHEIRSELAGGGPCSRELTLRARSGTWIDVLASFELIDLDDTPCMLIILNDITERKRMEVALQERTDELSERIKELQCLFSITNLLQTRGVDLGRVLQSVSEIIPRGWWHPQNTFACITYQGNCYTSDHGDSVVPLMAQPIAVNGQVVGRIEISVDAQGSDSPYPNEERILLATIAKLLGDYLEREQSGEALRESRHRYEQLILNAPLGIAVFDRTGLITITNPTAKALLGLPEDSPVSLYEHAFFAQTRLVEAVSTCIEKRRHSVIEVSHNRGHDDYRRLRVHLAPICQEDGQLISVQAMFEDVTQHRESERQQNHRQKLEAVGELAAGIAHEINTPTQFIGDNIHFLQDAFVDLMRLIAAYDDTIHTLAPNSHHQAVRTVAQLATEIDLAYLTAEIPNAIRHSLDGVSRVANIVNAMRTFAHPASDVKVPMDINQALNNTLTVARNAYKYVANLETDFDDALPLVPCEPGEINQVFLNIIVNAAYAIEEQLKHDPTQDRGVITLRTRREGDNAVIQIKDTGTGIAPENINRVFDPFFTTKPVGKGTGQGLAIVHSIIVQKHQGRIELASIVGKGTQFTIYLPLAEV